MIPTLSLVAASQVVIMTACGACHLCGKVGFMMVLLTIVFLPISFIVSSLASGVNLSRNIWGICQRSFVYAPSKSETTLQYNVVPHWLWACTKWSLYYVENKPASNRNKTWVVWLIEDLCVRSRHQGQGEVITPHIYCNRADSRLAPSQWETPLQCNAVSHWLGANLESALWGYVITCPCHSRESGTQILNSRDTNDYAHYRYQQYYQIRISVWFSTIFMNS